jgi:hypothetical protein
MGRRFGRWLLGVCDVTGGDAGVYDGAESLSVDDDNGVGSTTENIFE